jgi:hypothetical protein
MSESRLFLLFSRVETQVLPPESPATQLMLRRHLRDAREREEKSGSGSELALAPYPATMCFDDALGDRQGRAHPAADSLGGWPRCRRLLDENGIRILPQ